MAPAELPRLEQILPHAGAMILLSRVLEHESGRTVCEARAGAHALARDASGGQPAWMGLEYMAQCVAAHAGLVGWTQGEPPRMGFLVGVRQVELLARRFRPGQRLVATARHVWGGTQGMVSFDCELADGESGGLLARGRINCFMPAGSAGIGALP